MSKILEKDLRSTKKEQNILIRTPKTPQFFTLHLEELKNSEVFTAKRDECGKKESDFQWTISKNIVPQKFESSTVSLPNLHKWGINLQCQEFIQRDEKEEIPGQNTQVSGQILYIPHEDDEAEFGTRKQVLSTSWFYPRANIRIKIEPTVETEIVSWCKNIKPYRRKWVRFYRNTRQFFAERLPVLYISCFLGIGLLIWGILGLIDALIGYNVCGNCVSYDRETGKKDYERVTHEFEGAQVECMNVDIAQMLASDHNTRTLNINVVGYCSVHETLLETTLPACPKYKESIK